jgi:hypothetical protein
MGPSLSEGITPVPDLPELTPEETGAVAAERIAREVEMTPEERGVAAAEKIAKGIEQTAAEKTIEDLKPNQFDMGQLTKLLGSSKSNKDEEEKEQTIPFASTVSFGGNLPSLPSGLPRNSGLGRRTS